MESGVLELLSVFFLGATKLLWAPGTAAAAGLTFWETAITCSLGSMAGILFFYYFGRVVFTTIDRWRASRRKGGQVKKIFTKRNRLVVNVKTKFGIIGLTFLTPCIISIPIGCIIAAKFYHHSKLTVPLLLSFSVIWSFILTIFAFYVKELFFV
ncbi:MAG: hypothetical protein MK086_04585 [Flavobacteriales bacterium]|nr:hypothetical protein [Flavobacteriales bacterium]